jgi:hypothetical protein
MNARTVAGLAAIFTACLATIAWAVSVLIAG